jgi:hypothetical protein
MQKFKNLIVGMFIVALSLQSWGQATTNSPYSRYGIGVLRSESFNQNFALGGAGLGFRSNNSLNLLNPASYSEISITTVEFGLTNNALWLSDGTQSQFQNNAYIDHLAFGFPVINDKWGMSFGMLPYSNVGYDYENESTTIVGADTINNNYYYKGDGGLNKVYLGNALKFRIDSTSNISFGVNASLIFGSINSDKKVVYGDLPNSFNLWEIKKSSVADFNFDAGIQYRKTFVNAESEKYNLTIGATYTLGRELKSKDSELLRTFKGNVDFGSLRDTILNIEEQAGVVELPTQIGGGIAFEKENKWTILVDYKTTAWDKVQNSESELYQYKMSHAINGGFEFIPKYDAFNNYFKRIKYRLGARYKTSYLSVNDKDINEYGITFGLSLPMKRTDTALPGLNIGVEYGKRGVAKDGLVEEKFVNFNIGITINDRWFIKRKYD